MNRGRKAGPEEVVVPGAEFAELALLRRASRTYMRTSIGNITSVTRVGH
jgi:hypothetical protein